MDQVQHVLFPTDFSPHSLQPLPIALHIARACRATLTIFHVLTPDTVGAEGDFPTQEEVEKAYGSALDSFAALAGSLEGPPVDIHKITSRSISAADSILQFSETNGVDLVVMATHGRRGAKHLMLGSVAEQIARKAPCPVLIANPADRLPTTKGPEKVMAAIDFSPNSVAALETAAAFAAMLNAELRAVHVVEIAPIPVCYADAAPPEIDFSAFERAAETNLEEQVAALSLPDSMTSIEVRRGYAPDRLAQAAQDWGATLMVAGCRGLTGLSHLILGSTTDRLVRQITCPLLVTR